jgi:hypothetical protein
MEPYRTAIVFHPGAGAQIVFARHSASTSGKADFASLRGGCLLYLPLPEVQDSNAIEA